MLRKDKKTYREALRDIFYRIRIHPWHQRIMLFPLWVRWCMSIFLFLFGIVGLLTPIPAGWVMIMTAGVLVFGLRTICRRSMRLFFLLRLHRVYGWIRYKFKK